MRLLLVLGSLFLLLGCSKEDPVLTGTNGPRVDVADGEFQVIFERANTGPLLSRINRQGRFLEREQPTEADEETAFSFNAPWQVAVERLTPEVGSLRWRKNGEADRVLGRVPILDGQAAYSQPVRSGDLLFVAWVEQVPGAQRLMLGAINAATGELLLEILKDGVAENASPAIGVLDQQLLLAYVRRGRLKTKLVRLPPAWFLEPNQS